MNYKVVSCDCFEEIRKEIEKKVQYPLYGIKHLYCIPIFDDKKEKEKIINFSDMNLPKITTCPFCGKEIEIEEVE